MESHTMDIYLHKWQMHFIKTSLNNFSWHLKEERKGVRRYLFCKHIRIDVLRAVQCANDLWHCIKEVSKKTFVWCFFKCWCLLNTSWNNMTLTVAGWKHASSITVQWYNDCHLGESQSLVQCYDRQTLPLQILLKCCHVGAGGGSSCSASDFAE